MRIFAAFLVILLSQFLIYSKAIAQSNPLTPAIPSQSQLSRLNLTRMWWGVATMDARRDKLVFVSLHDDLLFAHSSAGILNCFDSETGKRKWVISLGGEGDQGLPPAVNESLVLMVSGSRMLGLNRETGDVIWEFSLPRSPSTNPVVDSTQVYIGLTDGSMMAYSLSELDRIYRGRKSKEASFRATAWKYAITGHITQDPVTSNDMIAFSGSNRTTYAISRSRDLRYTFDTQVAASAGLTTANGLLIVSSGDARLFALHIETGSLAWENVVGAPIRRTPTSIQEDLFVTPEGLGMFRILAKSGAELWDRPVVGVDEFVGASPTSVYGSDKLLNLVKLNRADGQIRGRLPLDRFTIRVNNDKTDRLYMASKDGLIIALRERDSEFPLYFKFPERLPIMPELAPEKPAGDAAPAEGEMPEKTEDSEEKPESEE